MVHCTICCMCACTSFSKTATMSCALSMQAYISGVKPYNYVLCVGGESSNQFTHAQNMCGISDVRALDLPFDPQVLQTLRTLGVA